MTAERIENGSPDSPLNFLIFSDLIGPGRPFDLAVFEDRLWISDWEHQQLRSIHKRTGKKLLRIHGNMVQPAAIVVVHPLAKPGTEKQQELSSEEEINSWQQHNTFPVLLIVILHLYLQGQTFAFI